MAVGGVFFFSFFIVFSYSVHLNVESQLSVGFLGTLDDQQLLVIEGSCQSVRSVLWTNTW